MTTAMLRKLKAMEWLSMSPDLTHTPGASSSGRWRKHPFYMLFPPEK